jgi:hypothetical protein
MTAEKAIIGLVPTAMSLNLASSMYPKKGKKKKKLIGSAVDAFVGIPLIKAAADEAAKF